MSDYPKPKSALCLMLAGSAVSLTALVLGAASASAQTLSLKTGSEYSTGDFGGDADSEIFLTGLMLSLAGESRAISLSTSYARLTDVSTLTTVGPNSFEVAPSADGSASGFTDLVIGVSQSFVLDSPLAPVISLSGSVKLPTANEEEGLSTGAVDYTLQGEVVHSLGPFTTFASLAGRFRGDSETVDVANSLLASAGVQKPLGERSTAGLLYEYRGNSVINGEDAHELKALYARQLTGRLNISVYGYTGFTDASPDVGFGFTLSRALWVK